MAELTPTQRLVKAGFVKKQYEGIKEELKSKADSITPEEASQYADEETMEFKRNAPFTATGYPQPITRKDEITKRERSYRWRLVHETFKESIEAQYFWLLNYLNYDVDFFVDKIYDVFAASEQSAFFGAAQQKLGMQQDRVSQFLATIGKMVKELFQLVRELRILDERLGYYKDSYGPKNPNRESAEITLKGIYIDMVEGGAKSPASVYGMARELQFTTLPDLFFSVHPITSKEVDAVVEDLQFNRKVKEVLKRKLYSFLTWKEHTYKELDVKRKFTLKYLRQHYDIIKMYMAWVRPYLRQIRRLQLVDRTTSPHLISAFEGSLVEIEILAKKKVKKGGKYNACILLNFNYRTRPSMEYTQQEYQHKGPIHVGRNEITFRTYAWTDDEIQKYKQMREEEDFELLGVVDASVKAAMEALGEELENYLKESGEEIVKKEIKKHQQKKSFFGFNESIASFKRTFISAKPTTYAQKKPKEKVDKFALDEEKKDAEKTAIRAAWISYKNYKKAHGMLAW